MLNNWTSFISRMQMKLIYMADGLFLYEKETIKGIKNGKKKKRTLCIHYHE